MLFLLIKFKQCFVTFFYWGKSKAVFARYDYYRLSFKSNFKGTNHNLPTSSNFFLKMLGIQLAYDEKDLKRSKDPKLVL